jgi:hypothetical protein
MLVAYLSVRTTEAIERYKPHKCLEGTWKKPSINTASNHIYVKTCKRDAEVRAEFEELKSRQLARGMNKCDRTGWLPTPIMINPPPATSTSQPALAKSASSLAPPPTETLRSRSATMNFWTSLSWVVLETNYVIKDGRWNIHRKETEATHSIKLLPATEPDVRPKPQHACACLIFRCQQSATVLCAHTVGDINNWELATSLLPSSGIKQSALQLQRSLVHRIFT